MRIIELFMHGRMIMMNRRAGRIEEIFVPIDLIRVFAKMFIF